VRQEENQDMNTSTRCTDPKQGIKVLSYDLLEGAERDEVDAHLEECSTCRDLRDQVFGSEGAFRELEYRAFKLSQRQKVPASAYFAQRLQSLWMPFLAAIIVLSAIGFWLVTRSPEADSVQLMRLQTFRAASLDTTSTVLMPRLEPGIESIVVQTDRDAYLLVYETGDEVLRRLIPGLKGSPPVAKAREAIEVALPPTQYAHSRILLVVLPATQPIDPDLWDQALLRFFGSGGDVDFEHSRRRWPDDIVPRMKWIQ
jgi:hypothetical protein